MFDGQFRFWFTVSPVKQMGGGGFFSSEMTVDSYPYGAAFSSGFTVHDFSDQYGVKALYADQEVYIHPHSTNGM